MDPFSRNFLMATSSPLYCPKKTQPCAPDPSHLSSRMSSKLISKLFDEGEDAEAEEELWSACPKRQENHEPT